MARWGPGGEGGEAGLGERLVVVDPDGAVEDGRVVRFVDVDYVGGSVVGVLGRDGDEKGDVAQVVGPAAGEEPQNDFVAWGQICVCVEGIGGAETVAVSSGCYFEVL